MNLLMLSPSPNIQGPLPKHTPLLINALQNLDINVTYEPWGCHKDNETRFEKVVGRIVDIFRIYKKYNKSQFDILLLKTGHNRASISRDLLLLTFTRHLSKKSIIFFHGSQSNKLVNKGNILFKFSTLLLLKLTNASILLSTEELREFQKFFPQGRFFTASNPYLPKHNHDTNNEPLQWHIPSDKSVLLFVGRLVPEKGIFDLLNAMPVLTKKNNCYLVVCGDGKYRRAVQNTIDNLYIRDSVTCTGYVNDRLLSKIYALSSILVLPTYHYEGFPTVITEAMSAGLPIITTQIRGAADFLENDVNAIFIQPKSPDEISNAVNKILSDPNMLINMSIMNREKVKIFYPDEVAKTYLNIFNQVVDLK